MLEPTIRRLSVFSFSVSFLLTTSLGIFQRRYNRFSMRAGFLRKNLNQFVNEKSSPPSTVAFPTSLPAVPLDSPFLLSLGTAKSHENRSNFELRETIV